MGSPISGLVAEMFLQIYKNLVLKHVLESNNIILYNWHVDDIW
jgi:hypothetical protein